MRGNGCLLLTAYYWSFFNVLSKLDPPNCRVGLSMLSIHLGAGSYEAGHQLTSQTASLKGHFVSESDSIRGEQPGSKPNKSVCQVCNKSVESCLPLIAPTKTHKSHPRGKKLPRFLWKWLIALVCNRFQALNVGSEFKSFTKSMVIWPLSRSIATYQKAYQVITC